MTLRVVIVVVNYNGRGHLATCLASLAEQTRPHRVLVIDNASSDGSARAARQLFPAVSFIPLRTNVGFARAVNVAASRIGADADVLVTLNPDTRAEPDFLARLVGPLEHDARLGSVAGTLVFATRPEVVASAGIDVHRNGVALDARLGERRPAGDLVAVPVFGASGGAAAYRLSAFREVGGFPEPFFLYLEDVDLAWRLRMAGWDAVWAPGAVAAHAYSASAKEGSALKRRLLARNRLWTLARCLPGDFWASDWRSIVWYDALAFAWSVVTRDWAATRGRLEGLALLPVRLAERTKTSSLASTDWRTLDIWIKPPVSIVRLRQLRALTAQLAQRDPNSASASALRTGDVH